jgi:ribosomal protein L37AE/L43A
MSLELNPGSDIEVSKNPLCPECKQQIVPVERKNNTVFRCGCMVTKNFTFTKFSDMTQRVSSYWEDGR